MERAPLHALNAIGLTAALVLGATIAWAVARPVSTRSAQARSSPSAQAVTELDDTGQPIIRGGDGIGVPVHAYGRIVSLVPEVDDALVELGMIGRLAGISAYSREHSQRARILQLVPGTIASGAGVEDLIALSPDLVLVAAFSDEGRSARLRSAGIPVFNLGQERGAHDAAMGVRRLAALCGDAAAGDALAARFERRLAHVVEGNLPRMSACYVSCYGTRLFGGSTGTSYADILDAAGLDDAAAAHGYSGRTAYRIEDLLAIAPEVIVTGTGMAAIVKGLPGSRGIPAVAHDRIIEVDPNLLDSPGIAILEAAEAVAVARERLP